MKTRYIPFCATVGGSALVIFVLCLWLVIGPAPALNYNDTAIRSFVNAHQTGGLTTFFTHLTLLFNVESTPVIAGIVTIIALILYGWRAGLQVILTVCTGALLNHLIKGWVQRPWPTNEVLMHYAGWSFPSGHSALSVLVLGSLLLLILRSKWPVKYRHLLATLLFVLILLIGISRLYVGAHYLSDVVAG